MLLSELLRSEVRTESGKKLGHVFDVRVARSPRSSTDRVDQTWRLKGLLVGSRGARERFGISHGQLAVPLHKRDAIGWEDVVRVEGGTIVVREDAAR
jgi:sporulation protein YlmC with PRC-barrel domain